MATFSGKALQSAFAPETPDQVGERASHQEVLLDETQSLPHHRGIVGIEHAVQGLGA
jgi:hypothetical protein